MPLMFCTLSLPKSRFHPALCIFPFTDPSLTNVWKGQPASSNGEEMMAAGCCRDVGYGMSLSLLPCLHHAHLNSSLPVSASMCDLQALQACFMGLAGP